MRFMRMLVTLTTVGAISAVLAGNALAVSTFHSGACGDGTTSITLGVDSLTSHGNLAVSASFMGFSAVNGSLKAQMKNGLVMGEVAQATWMKNRGCSGGRYFNAKNRLLTKGEKAATRRPANIEPRKVCVPHAKGCKRITIVVRKAFPATCWNGDSNRVLMWLWVKSPSKAKKPPVKPKSPVKKLVSATATATVTIPVASSAASAASAAAAAACPGNTAAAASAASTASATVVASVSASVTETATGATYKEAYDKAYNKALKEANERAQKLAADAVASAASAASAAASASCSSVTPPVVSPPTVSVNYIQEIDVSNGVITSTWQTCASPTAQSGDALTIIFTVNLGNYGIPGDGTMTYTTTATGVPQSFCPTYVAPTEPGTDQVTVTVLDRTTGLKATGQSNAFHIVIPTSNP